MGKKNRTTLEEFKKRSSEIHSDKYDYSEVQYVNANTKITIICPIHGKFEQTPASHLNAARGCQSCGGNKRHTTESYVLRCKSVHTDKRYSYDKTLYSGWNNKIIVSCEDHGDFSIKAGNFVNGQGCPKCAGKRKTTEDFVSESKSVHGELYDYSETVYRGATTKVTIICKRHGSFLKTPSDHLNGGGCQKCAKHGPSKFSDNTLYVYITDRFVGFGVTKDFTTRHRCHVKNLRRNMVVVEQVITFNLHGEDAYKIETNIKRKFLTINTGIDGFKTEALPLTELHNLLDYINENRPEGRSKGA